MASINSYTSKNAKAAKLTLPKGVVEKENLVLLAQAVHVYRDRAHRNKPVIKSRAEVRASTRKIYRQKGTGRARHGASSAPLFVGGGKAHGPRGLDRELTLPRKMRKKALGVAVGIKLKEGLVVGADMVGVKKTKDAKALVENILKGTGAKQGSRVLIALAKQNREVKRNFRNLENVAMISYEDLNAYRVYLGGILVIDKEAFGKAGARK